MYENWKNLKGKEINKICDGSKVEKILKVSLESIPSSSLSFRGDLSLSKKLCKSYKGGRFGLLK